MRIAQRDLARPDEAGTELQGNERLGTDGKLGSVKNQPFFMALGESGECAPTQRKRKQENQREKAERN